MPTMRNPSSFEVKASIPSMQAPHAFVVAGVGRSVMWIQTTRGFAYRYGCSDGGRGYEGKVRLGWRFLGQRSL